MVFAVPIFSEGFGMYYVCADGLATRMAMFMVFQDNIKLAILIFSHFLRV